MLIAVQEVSGVLVGTGVKGVGAGDGAIVGALVGAKPRQIPLDRGKRRNFSNCESLALDYSEEEPSSALAYLPAAIPGLSFFGSYYGW